MIWMTGCQLGNILETAHGVESLCRLEKGNWIAANTFAQPVISVNTRSRMDLNSKFLVAQRLESKSYMQTTGRRL